MILAADSEGPDQNVWMRRLIWAFMSAYAQRLIFVWPNKYDKINFWTSWNLSWLTFPPILLTDLEDIINGYWYILSIFPVLSGNNWTCCTTLDRLLFFFFFSPTKKNCSFLILHWTYVVGTHKKTSHKKHLSKVGLMSTHNVCCCGAEKYLSGYPLIW